MTPKTPPNGGMNNAPEIQTFVAETTFPDDREAPTVFFTKYCNSSGNMLTIFVSVIEDDFFLHRASASTSELGARVEFSNA